MSQSFVLNRMRLALLTFERIRERLSESSQDVKGKLNSWMEGGLEHMGLMQGVKMMLEELAQALPNLQNPHEITASTGSPREKLVRVNHFAGIISSIEICHNFPTINIV